MSRYEDLEYIKQSIYEVENDWSLSEEDKEAELQGLYATRNMMIEELEAEA